MNDLSIIRLVGEATIVVQLVLALLLLASVYSWTIIFAKRRALSATKDSLTQFEQEFWSRGDLNTLHREIEAAGNARGIEAIFRMGFGNFCAYTDKASMRQTCCSRAPGVPCARSKSRSRTS
jgi:biopolymer transport protein TolQ